MKYCILRGDSLKVLRALKDNSVDSICTDPPYGLEFMNREWDGANGFRRSLNQADAERDSVFGRTSRTSPEYQTGRFAGAVTDRDFKGFVLSQQRTRNVKCPDCGKWAYDHPGRLCECGGVRRAQVNVFQAWCEAWATECLRVLKPGGHMLAFGGTRTYHRLACAIEDAGFEIRDSLHWIYGSGFPKSLDVSKAIDSRELYGGSNTRNLKRINAVRPGEGRERSSTANNGIMGDREGAKITRDMPATEQGMQWQGWGTALKPAHEPVVVARKPLAATGGSTVAANVLEWGTGGLNIGGCRVEGVKDTPASPRRAAQGPAYGDLGNDPGTGSGWDENTGRWPPNILLTHSADCRPAGTQQVKGGSRANRSDHANGIPSSSLSGGADGSLNRVQSPGYADADGTETVQAWNCAPDCPVAGLDAQSGVLTSGANTVKRASGKGGVRSASIGAESRPDGAPMIFYGDTGGASRFFPKLNWGEPDFPFMYCAKAARKERPEIEGVPSHPTVKPLTLIRWLVRLVTPPDGICLDLFAGTGTTAEACLEEGFRCILIEQDENYLRLIRARMDKRVPSLFD